MNQVKPCSIEQCGACGRKAPVLDVGTNIFLIFMKGLVGHFTGSRALVADAIHSGSDLVSALVTVWNTRENNEADNVHGSGNSKIESIVSVIVGLILVFAAFYIVFGSLRVLFSQVHVQPPKIFAFWIALLSIYLNFFVSNYAKCPAKELNNSKLKTISIDNRFDAYLSIPVALCVLFSQFGYPQLDSIGAAIVGVVVLKMGVEMIMENYDFIRNLPRYIHPENMTHAEKKLYAAKLSVLSNSILVTAKFVVGFITGAVSIIAEAIHSSLDLVASLIAAYSVKKASVPADNEHRFGHGKYENVSALLEGILIFFAAYLIFNEAFKKLIHGVHIEIIDLGIAVMLVATVTNIVISKYLFKVAKETDSEALVADALHLRTDVYTSAGVLLGLFLIRVINRPGVEILDPIIAIVTALIIIHAAYVLCKEAIHTLLDTELPKEEQEKILVAIKENTKEFVDFHSLRTRKAGSNRYIDMHLVLPKHLNIDEAEKLSGQVERNIKTSLDNIDIIIHVEPCKENCDKCNIKCDKSS